MGKDVFQGVYSGGCSIKLHFVLSIELLSAVRSSGVAEKYVGLVQGMYEDGETVVRCAVGATDGFMVGRWD